MPTQEDAIKLDIERLERQLLHTNSPLPSVTCTTAVRPSVQVMIDVPHTKLDGTHHAAIVEFRMENKEGFPVTLHEPNRCHELKWMVLSDGFVIDRSDECNQIFDPVHLRLEGSEVKYMFRPIMLKKSNYQTGNYTLRTWFWGVKSDTKFHVVKLPHTQLSAEAQKMLTEEEKYLTGFCKG